MTIRSLEVDLGNGHHLCQLDRLSQRLQVYVEYAKIADSDAVWVLKEVIGSEIQDFHYLIPWSDVDPGLVSHSQLRRSCPLKGDSLALNLDVVFPYKIQIPEVGWWYSDYPVGSRGSGGMVAFDLNKVSLRLDPK